jgi:DNA-binding transcriptional ArsR family regulator
VQNLLRAYKASVFQALAHPTRIAIVEALRDGELAAGSIQERLSLEQANLSQHLAVLRARQIVTNRKEGNQVFYSVRNPAFVQILDILRGCFEANLREAIQMLSEIEAEPRTK